VVLCAVGIRGCKMRIRQVRRRHIGHGHGLLRISQDGRRLSHRTAAASTTSQLQQCGQCLCSSGAVDMIDVVAGVSRVRNKTKIAEGESSCRPLCLACCERQAGKPVPKTMPAVHAIRTSSTSPSLSCRRWGICRCVGGRRVGSCPYHKRAFLLCFAPS
jgi:hypothetical protein